MDAVHIKRIFAAAIEKLPYQHKLVLSLLYVDQLSLNEIADVMSLPPADVYKLYLEAAASLPSCLHIH